MNKYLEMSKEVQDAVKNGAPIVALESTIISHGMPFPENKKTALEVQNIIREQGVLPATIAVIDGKLNESPCKGVKNFKKRTLLPRHLSQEDVNKLLSFSF